MSEPLIAKVQDDTKGLTGAGPFDSLEDVARDVVLPFQEGKGLDPTALGIDAAAAVMDVAGLMADPLGTLAASVVGWIIENVDFVREPFDKLAGDPPAIEAAATTWENIAKRLGEERDGYQTQLSSLGGWTGPAADTYRMRCSVLIGSLHQTSEAAAAVANKIKVAGVCVAATRTLVRDLIAELAGTLLAWGIPAAAAAVPTAGASVAAFITRAVTKAISIGTKIMKFLTKLFKALDKLGGLAKAAGDVMRKKADELAALGKSMPNSPFGNQRAGELAHDAATRTSRADGLDELGDNLTDAGTRIRESADNAMTRVDDWAQRTSQKVDDWAARVKENGPSRKQAIKDYYERMNQPPLSTRRDDLPDPRTAVQNAGDRIDAPLSKGLLDGQNWVRAVSSRDISHLMPNWGDLIAPTKEGMKEHNNMFVADDKQKWDEKDRR
ncbi:PPE domain-containing protein [Lentzea sp. NPDC042327]|uniref:WXG100 family type VII secretion target n=1 Tax=Lentzea sp. NPDC042327 TaxID=3154801 RepID=UPI0033FD41A5